MRFLKTGAMPPAKQLGERKKYLVYTAIGEKGSELRLGHEAHRYIKRFVVFNQDKKVRLSIHGNVACPGKVTGKVRIVNTAKQMHKIKEGDILVATQTTPELLPAMKKAAAFVTDIGGITSHAAIVSREMNKPCVIGTKLATQVFKDGDMVEVDANKGIVRKL
jgi:pyruvate,water dikinase